MSNIRHTSLISISDKGEDCCFGTLEKIALGLGKQTSKLVLKYSNITIDMRAYASGTAKKQVEHAMDMAWQYLQCDQQDWGS